MNEYRINCIFSDANESIQDIVENYFLNMIAVDWEGETEIDTNF